MVGPEHQGRQPGPHGPAGDELVPALPHRRIHDLRARGARGAVLAAPSSLATVPARSSRARRAASRRSALSAATCSAASARAVACPVAKTTKGPSALSLVLNAIVVFNTRYLGAASARLAAEGEFLEQLAEDADDAAPLRLLLLAREAGDWWMTLQSVPYAMARAFTSSRETTGW